MSVRNIRNHHTRGLLPPPEVRARVGYYNAEHVARLRLILDLQADGFNLTAIERLLSGSDGLAQRLLGLRTAVTTPYEPETPQVITGEELTERFGEIDAKDIARVRKLKLLVPLGEDRFEVPSPALLGRRRAGHRARDLAARRARARRARQPPLRVDRASIHAALPQRAVGALRTRRSTRRPLAGAHRRRQLAQAARLRGATRAVQAKNDRTARGHLRKNDRAPSQTQIAK